MTKKPPVLNASEQLQRALSRWDTDGGAQPPSMSEEKNLADANSPVPQLTNSELVHLRIRVITLENIIISFLATAPNTQLELVREMADYISPRSGSTCHPLTVHAAAHMVDLVERSSRFRSD